MSASVESFTTYYATCAPCRWDGPDREDDRARAEKDADEHKCAGEDRAELQNALDRAIETLPGRAAPRDAT